MMDQKKCCGKCIMTLVFFIAYLFIGAYALLWCWNTDAEIFKWPVAEYQHALAAMLAYILVILPCCCKFRHSHGGCCAQCGCKYCGQCGCKKEDTPPAQG